MPSGITYDVDYGHVCLCAASVVDIHDEKTGEVVESVMTYEFTVEADPDTEPTQSGSWFYICKRCGANGWSGC